MKFTIYAIGVDQPWVALLARKRTRKHTFYFGKKSSFFGNDDTLNCESSTYLLPIDPSNQLMPHCDTYV